MRNPFARPIVVAPIQRTENCFCGAALTMSIPVASGADGFPTDAVAVMAEWAEIWHKNHWHQTNPQQGDLVGVENIPTTAVAARAGLGFQRPQ